MMRLESGEGGDTRPKLSLTHSHHVISHIQMPVREGREEGEGKVPKGARIAWNQ